MDLNAINDSLRQDLRPLRFGPPVTHVYNPLDYARRPYEMYLKRYADSSREIILVGMNPGPWGMAQTGVPFGEVNAVKSWLDIHVKVGKPAVMHPKKPVDGFNCRRNEISGRRLWGWARKQFGSPQRFFKRFFVSNYCPLLFIEAGGRNLTPNNIRADERKPLLAVCDRALRRTVEYFKPRYVVGVGAFAAERCRIALSQKDLIIGRITHPSPANPKANQGWNSLIEEELRELGIRIK